MIMKPSIPFLICITLLLTTILKLPARTWTDAATGRTLEGDYVSSDATHVSIKSGDRNLKIEITRLSDTDKTFIKNQSAKKSDPASSAAKIESLDPTGLTLVACDSKWKVLASLVIPDDQKDLKVRLTLPEEMADIQVFVIGKRKRIFNPDGEADEIRKEFYEELFEVNTNNYVIYRRTDTKNTWSSITTIEKGVMQGMAGYSLGDSKPLKLTPDLKQAIQKSIAAGDQSNSIFTITEK